MKKCVIIILALLYIIQGTAKDIREIIIRGDSAFPPYEFINDKGEPDGFNIDLTRAIMEELKLPYDLQLGDWSDILQQFENGKIDLITGMAKFESPKDGPPKLSKAHSYINYKFVCRKDAPIQHTKDLSHKNIIVQRHALPHKKLKDMGYSSHLIPVDNMMEGLNMLSEGKGDMAICLDNMAQYIIYKDGLTNLSIIDSEWPLQEYCFVGTDPQLLEQINSALLRLKKNGVYDRIHVKWLGEKPTFSIPTWLYFLLGTLLLTALLLSIFVTIYKKRAKKGEILLKEENEKLRFAIQTAGMAMWEYNCETQLFTTYNEPVADYKDGAAISMDTYDCYSKKDDDNPELIEKAVNIVKARKNESYNFIIKMKTKYDSDWQYCTVRGVPMEKDKDGAVTKYLGVRLNITEQINYQKFLEREKETAQQADKLKSAFLANMSHEIRTPLNAIVGFSELLQTTEDVNMRKEFMNIINNNNELLLRLIGDILDLSKIESGLMELKLELFDLADAYKDTFMALKQRCTNPEVEFLGHNPYKKCLVKLDKNRLVQVGTNFITNAIKHTDKGRITMGYRYIDGGIKLYVEDTGHGIPIEKQHKLFQRFAKLDDFTQGTGLGLAICKAITDAQGGKIGMESTEGKGSKFWAWFPCEAEIEEYEETKKITEDTLEMDYNPAIDTLQESCTNDVQKKSILVAEDIDSNYMLVKALLKTSELTRAYTGKEAVELASSHHYDAILMDMKMPVMGGLEATREIRKFDTKTPIIAVTANAFEFDREEAMRAGCNAFITKPLNKKELKEVLGD